MNLVPEYAKKIDLTPDPFPHGNGSQKPNIADKSGTRIAASGGGNLPDQLQPLRPVFPFPCGKGTGVRSIA
jgi:hypothetical protein